MRLTALYVHPVKSAAAVSVPSAEVEARGLRYDRRWMIVDDEGRFRTQRSDPRLGRIQPSIDGDALHLDAPSATRTLTVPAEPDGTPDRRVTIWDDEVEAVDAGDDAATWLAEVLDPGLRLVGLPPSSTRPTDPAYSGAGDEVAFADGFPYLLASTASLRDLEDRAGTPLSMRRFRPNLVIDGEAPFEEDAWAAVTIGDVRFRVVKPCVRCVLTTLDPDTGEAGHEPLRTLATFRRRPKGGVTFGQNLIADGTGRIAVGAELVAEPRNPDAGAR